MRPRPSQPQIRLKVSTMPRQKTEAAAYLDIYKLVNEKTRLQQEFETLEERRDRIQKRLDVLDSAIADLEKSAHQLRDAAPVQKDLSDRAKAPGADDLNTLVLEY